MHISRHLAGSLPPHRSVFLASMESHSFAQPVLFGVVVVSVWQYSTNILTPSAMTFD